MKKCSHCAEEIQDDAIKCKYCKSDLSKTKNATPGSYKGLAITTLILGILSMFFGSIGIIPFTALIVSMVALFKIKSMRKSNKIITVIGFLLALIYSINFYFVFSAVGPNVLSIGYNKSDNEYTKITDMKYSQQTNGQRTISWWFNGPGLNSDEVNREEWGCYKNCQLIVSDNKKGGELLFTSQMPTENGCDNWYNIPTQYNTLFNGAESFCVQIVCDDNKKSDRKCWENN